MIDMTICPECGERAEVQWRAVLASTDGPIEHARILCARDHCFFLPVAALVRAERAAAPKEHRPARPVLR